MGEREEDKEQLEVLLDKLDNWNAEFDNLEAKSRKAGPDPKSNYDE